MESELLTLKKKSDYFEREMQDVSEKLAFAHTNYLKRDEDLAVSIFLGIQDYCAVTARVKSLLLLLLLF